jgi:voltage-gated potassium channel
MAAIFGPLMHANVLFGSAPRSVLGRQKLDNSIKTLEEAGAHKVISPYDIGARRMAHAILRPTVI